MGDDGRRWRMVDEASCLAELLHALHSMLGKLTQKTNCDLSCGRFCKFQFLPQPCLDPESQCEARRHCVVFRAPHDWILAHYCQRWRYCRGLVPCLQICKQRVPQSQLLWCKLFTWKRRQILLCECLVFLRKKVSGLLRNLQKSRLLVVIGNFDIGAYARRDPIQQILHG